MPGPLPAPLPPALHRCGLPSSDSRGSGLGKLIICVWKCHPAHMCESVAAVPKQVCYSFKAEPSTNKQWILLWSKCDAWRTGPSGTSDLNQWCLPILKSSLSMSRGQAGGVFTALWGLYQKHSLPEAVPKGTMLACHSSDFTVIHQSNVLQLCACKLLVLPPLHTASCLSFTRLETPHFAFQRFPCGTNSINNICNMKLWG